MVKSKLLAAHYKRVNLTRCPGNDQDFITRSLFLSSDVQPKLWIPTQSIGYDDDKSHLINNHEKPEEEVIIVMTHIEADITSDLQDMLSSFPVTFNAVQDGT